MSVLLQSNRPIATAISTLIVLAAMAPPGAYSQEHEREIEGVVRAADTSRPLAGVQVSVLGVVRFAITHGDGSFHVAVPAQGTYTVRAERLGYATLEREVAVGSSASIVILELSESALQLDGLVITGALSERSADDALRPVSVLNAEELQRRLGTTVAATLSSEPGLSVTTMGPATARPVVRGLSGDRLLVLEDGARVVDVSNTGSDHATALDPTSARRIEVVRGPGAILYGSNALGGVINVIRDEIPSQVPHHPTGSVTLQGRSVNGGGNAAAQIQIPLNEHVPLRAEVSVRSAGDLATPLGHLLNTGLDSWNVGVGTSWVGDRGFIGASLLAFRNDYGIPGGFVGGHADGVRIESERNSAKLRAQLRPEQSLFSSIQADASYTYFKNTEIEPPDILGTLFEREAASFDVLARHDAWGPFSVGAVGGRAAWESFGFAGGLFTPDSERLSGGVFAFQEVDVEPVRLEVGVRYDRIQTKPLRPDPDSDIGNVRTRGFGAFSGSIGMLVNAADGLTLGASVSRAFRTPDVNELFSEGPHLAAYSFEVGNPSLNEEVGTGFDVFARVHSDRVHAELTGFLNEISGFVFGRETGELSRTRLPIYQFFGEDARFVGFEGGLDWVVAGALKVESTLSYVRGTIRGTDEPLPLIPPLQIHGALAYEPSDWFARAEVKAVEEQDRVGEFETRTDGYTVFDLSGGVRMTVGGRLNTITATLNNVTNEEYRNHLSRVKEIMPEAGRGVTLTYRIVF